MRCTWTGRINLKILLGYDINYLSIWPFMVDPWILTRKASKLTFACFQLAGWWLHLVVTFPSKLKTDIGSSTSKLKTHKFFRFIRPVHVHLIPDNVDYLKKPLSKNFFLIILQSIHQVDMKNVVKSAEDFFAYFRALKTKGVLHQNLDEFENELPRI